MNSDELKKLQELFDRGALSADEFAEAKKAVLSRYTLEGESDRSKSLQKQMAQLKLETDLLRVEREWNADRERYIIRRNRGGDYIPTHSGSVVQGLCFVILGAVTFVIGGSQFFLIALPVVGLGLLLAAYLYSKASQYNVARLQYEKRRAELIEQHDRSQNQR